MILEASHDHQLAGHMGVDNTFQRLSEKYYWATMYEDIRTHVRTCDTYQRRRKEKETEPLQPVKVTTAFAHIGINIIGPLPRTLRGNRYIIMVIDYLTKYPEAYALQLTDSLDIICQHGIPLKITSDQRTEFVNELVRTLCQQYRIR